MNTVSFSHNKGFSVHHLNWSPKYRYNMFRKEVHRKSCDKILRAVAARHGIAVVELAVALDHVHCVVSIPASMSVSKAVMLLKGGSAYEIFRYDENFRKRYPRGHFWSAGFFHKSVGDADIETTVRYVQRHQATLQEFSN